MYNLRARFYDPSNGRFNAMDTFRGNNFDPQSLHKYAYAHCDPVNGIDPLGTSFFPTTLGLLVVAAILLVLVVLLVSQVTINYQKYFGLSDKDRAAARAHNANVMQSLRRIIESDGERTFQQEHLGIGGIMGTTLPGNSAFQRAANLWEALRNVEVSVCGQNRPGSCG